MTTDDLFINSKGAYLQVTNQMFCIRTKDAKTKKYQAHPPIAPHTVHRIFLHRGTAVSVDAMHLALINNIDIVLMQHDDHPIGRVWHTKLGSTTKIRKRQLEASLNAVGTAWVKQWLSAKLGNQVAMIEQLKKHRESKRAYLHEKVDKIKAMQMSIEALEADHTEAIADTLRGLEGTAGRLYFETLSYVLAKAYQFVGRSKRPAHDAFNAFLNYGYGVLYSMVEHALVIAGIDPFVGFMHRDGYNQRSMVYDFIEPYRGYVEQVVMKLFTAKKVNQSHTDAIKGGVRLNETGKPLLTEALGQYLRGDKVKHGRKQQTRENIIKLEAVTFAQSLLAG
ncbi:CRISPR-associated endonuclease Cas1 [uncultured Microscilla sp.]|uniref:CRISPR-associated endonuclease Cas1 n=1 Tax=uncultured Microscilla sp. TaxID=432653 RepID=UPI0026270209|nr:CRISPR-associated endonuclease Cas1 [uncultured Microscilla sp.]